MRKLKNPERFLLLVCWMVAMAGCAGIALPYKAYLGEIKENLQLSTLAGSSYQRIDLINRYVDTVRFMSVDEISIQNSQQYDSIQIEPGFHEVRVYFSWDLGVQRGLAPAMVDYARTRDHVSRTLRFNARAGESYSVNAQPFFDSPSRNITTLSHVDFWVVDANGTEIVTQEQGRYIPSTN
ncbi:MAG: hypothetical protein QGG54_13020 [Gammaproteobacteria bacterium]|nr:hypothetical protein [Gammaproteobacteria bacterium]